MKCSTALTASFAAGRIGEIHGTRLSARIFDEVRDFYNNPYWPNGKRVRF